MKNQKMGFFGFLIIIFIIAMLVQYWYIFVAVLVLGGAAYLYDYRRQQAIAAQAAKTAQAQAAEQATIARLKAYKDLLDTGAITQEDYNHKKAELLRLDSHEELKF